MILECFLMMLNINFFLLSSHFLLLRVEVKCKNFIHWYHKDVLVTFVILMVARTSSSSWWTFAYLLITMRNNDGASRVFNSMASRSAMKEVSMSDTRTASCSFMLRAVKKEDFSFRKKVRHY